MSNQSNQNAIEHIDTFVAVRGSGFERCAWNVVKRLAEQCQVAEKEALRLRAEVEQAREIHAVIFDLFGALQPTMTFVDWRQALDEIRRLALTGAAVEGMPKDSRLWHTYGGTWV